MGFISPESFQDFLKIPTLFQWIKRVHSLVKPERVFLCEGSEGEFQEIASCLVENKQLIRLNPNKRPHSFLAFSDPLDVARVEENTYICSDTPEEAGPTNHWADPALMREKLEILFRGSMQGRTMYIIPFCLGPFGSDKSYIGVQITDSGYVVLNMRIMTRMGERALKELEKKKFFVPCLHSVGAPLQKAEKDVAWPCNVKNRLIVHFPKKREIYSFGSGYGGNALLGKKCFALRIASVLAREEKWLAEHMLILGLTNPEGEKKYIAASFPSACGKTNLAMLSSSLPGWKIECVGDDIAWMKIGKEGKLWAINPEAGMFGVAPGTSEKTNPNAMRTIEKNTIFTNAALTQEGDIWWEGLSFPPEKLTDWQKREWKRAKKEKAAHPNARFTAPLSQCPIKDLAYEDPQGVPISAIVFGGRRSNTIPLVLQSFDWEHGVFLGASVSSITTAAAKGEVGKLRHDPFSMLPFCGYNMGDYFAHWLEMGDLLGKKKQPLIFHVNWFQKSETGDFLWPGFGENIRILQWIFERITHKKEAYSSPIGLIPKLEDLNIEGLSLSQKTLERLFHIDPLLWKKEIKGLKSYFSLFGNSFPKKLKKQLEDLEKRFGESFNTKG